ncbi:hypothetical protein GF378_02785 [Candidatus Pacearchaeota archaeon]|nr:hypothetical protein [Candidatus Pacearchaeota archaeon]
MGTEFQLDSEDDFSSPTSVSVTSYASNSDYTRDQLASMARQEKRNLAAWKEIQEQYNHYPNPSNLQPSTEKPKEKGFFSKVRNGLLSLVLSTALMLPFGGCGDSGGDDGNGGPGPEPDNYKPEITATFPGTGMENQEYTGIVELSDAEGDPITFNVVDGPAGYWVNQTDTNTYEIKFIPDDSQSATTHHFTLEASDGLDHNDDSVVDSSDSTIETTNLFYITNVETASGNVSAYGSGNNLASITVSFDNGVDSPYVTQTDSSGNWTQVDLPDEEYNVMIKDENTGSENGGIRYETYAPRPFLVNKTKAAENKLEKNCRMFKVADRDFINDVGRNKGEVRKWKSKPKFKIYLRETVSGQRIDDLNASALAGVRDCIKTELSQFCQGSYTFTDADIEEVDSTFAGEEDGYVTVYWNDSITYGDNYHNIDSNYGIINANSRFNPNTDKITWLQELSENMIGGGETNDTTNYSDSAFCDPASATSYSQEDLVIGESHYLTISGKDLSRPAGNTDTGSEGYNDYDGWVSGYWNE